MTIKLTDGKGRLTLGPQFANKTVIIEEIDETEVRVIAAAVVPERELWLHKDLQAKQAIERGLEQARNRHFSKRPPVISKDAKFVEQIAD